MHVVRALFLSATSFAALTATFGMAASATPIVKVANNSGTLVTSVAAGDQITGGVGYTLVDGTSATLGLRAYNLNSGRISTSAVSNASAAPIGLTLSGVGSSISGGTTNFDAFNVLVRPATTGGHSGTFTYRASGRNGYTTANPDTETVTVNTTGVAPTANAAANSLTVRAGTTGSINLTVSNTGDGNRAGTDNGGSLKSNLRGTVDAATGVISGSGGAFNIKDQFGSTTTSQAFAFNYAPTARGAATTTVATSFQNGIGTTNAAGSMNTVLTGNAVGPDYAASLNTAGNTLGSNDEIQFTNLGLGVATQTLLVSNTSNDILSSAATRLTITAQIIGDASSEYSFSLSDFFTGNGGSFTSTTQTATLNAMNYGAELGKIAVQFVSKTGGDGQAQLKIRTDEESALGVMGSQVYVYNLIGGTGLSSGSGGVVPEPGTIMVLGTSLLGLAIARRRGQARKVAARRPNDPDVVAPTG